MKTKSRPLIFAAAALVLAALLLFFFLGRGPGTSGPADPLERFSAHCGGVVVVPELGRLGERLALLPKLKLAQLAATLGGYPDAERFIGELTRAAGVDLRSRDSLLGAGIDPAGSLVLFAPEGGGPVAAVPVADREKLEAFLEKHAKTRLAAQQRATRSAGGHSLTTWSAEGAAAPSLAFAFVDRALFVGANAAGLATLESVLQQSAEGSLARDERFAATRTRLGANEAFAFACPGSKNAQLLDLPYGAGASLSLSAKEASVSLDVPLDDALAKRLASLGTPAGAELLAHADPASFLIARIGLDPSALAPLAGTLVPKAFQRALRQAQVAPADVLASLKPGTLVTMSLAPTATLGTTPVLDLTRTNPFHYLHLQAVGRAQDPEKARGLLEKTLAVAPRYGATIVEGESAGAKTWTFNYHLGEGARIALKDDLALVTGGQGQLEELLARIAEKTPATLEIDPGAKTSLESDGLALFVDVARLSASVRKLPDSAYGIGGFAIKAAVGRWLDAIEEIGSLRLSARVADRTLRAELVLSLEPAPEPQAASRTP